MTWEIRKIRTERDKQQALWDVVKKYTGHPILIDWTAQLINLNNIPERNSLALSKSILEFSQNNIKYFREEPERFASPIRTLIWGIGDCDDKSIFIGSVLRSFKIPVKFNFIKYQSPNLDGTKKDVNHVYPLAKIDNKWIALESVRPWPIGKDPAIEAVNKGYKVNLISLGDK